MSNENTEKNFTITSKGDTLTVSSPSGQTHRGRMVDPNEIRFDQPGPQSGLPNGNHTSKLLEGGGVEVETFSGTVKKDLPSIHRPAHDRNANPGLLSGTIQDIKTGIPCHDMRKAVSNPDDYTIQIGGTKTSLANALRLGLAFVDGDGRLKENIEEISYALNPSDPVHPYNQTRDTGPDVVDFQEPEVTAFNHLAKQAGLDGGDLMAKALTSKDAMTAAKQLADNLGGGQDANELKDIIQGVAHSRLTSVAKALEAVGKLQEGEGWTVLDALANHASPGVGRPLINAMMMGHVDSLIEAVRRYTRRELH